MEQQFEYKGYQYWVKVEPAIHTETKETGYIAYVNNEKPGGLLYGETVRDHEGKVMFFTSELSAFTNANAVKRMQIDLNPNNP